MRRLLRAIDRFLNTITMYRLVVYALGLMLAAGVILAATGALSLSAGGLLLSAAVLVAVCYGANFMFARLFRVASNSESWLITALILACILPPADSVRRVLYIAVTGLLAMAVKYAFTWRGSHLFNPAAFGAVVVSVAGILPVIWWIGSPPLLPVTAVLGLLVLRKTRRFMLFGSFMIAALVMMELVAALHGLALAPVLRAAFLSWPLVFMGTIMLTEPATLPAGRSYIIMYGALVGWIFACQLHIGPVGSTPHVALIIGNLFSLLVTPKYSRRVRLARITPMGPDLYDLAFTVPAGGALRFTPGQYAEWTLPHPHADSRGNRRTFSIASSPTESELHIGIKQFTPSSSFKKALLAMQPGDYIQVAHVNGSFVLPADPARKLLFIAGGIGITPYRSMLQYLADSGQRRDAALVYGARSATEFVYQPELQRAAAQGVRVEQLTQLLDGPLLTRLVPDLPERAIYISGPEGMVQGVKRTLLAAGVAARHIHTDYFSGY